MHYTPFMKVFLSMNMFGKENVITCADPDGGTGGLDPR